MFFLLDRFRTDPLNIYQQKFKAFFSQKSKEKIGRFDSQIPLITKKDFLSFEDMPLFHCERPYTKIYNFDSDLFLYTRNL